MILIIPILCQSLYWINKIYLKREYWHCHIEAATDGVFKGGNTRVDPEKFMKTKFDETIKGNPIK